MAVIRLYLTALTLVFFLAVVMTIGIGVLEATVMTTVPLLLILDMREELSTVRSLEKQIANLSQ
jgi:flagellar motor switch protein FliM